MATRLRVPLSPIAEGRLELAETTARYVFRVHRLEKGDRFVGFDPELGIEADGEVIDPERRSVILSSPRRSTSIAGRRITLVQALAKGDKMDSIVRDATELGATRIGPAIAERSVALHSGKGAVERWRRIALEAARQSGRGDLPVIDAPAPLAAISREMANESERRFALVVDASRPFGLALEGAPSTTSLAIAIGPEGGFGPTDLEHLDGAGFERVRLGSFVMRAETAAAAALGAIAALLDRVATDKTGR